MEYHTHYECDTHNNRFDCPECTITYNAKFDEYGLIIHGTDSYIIINYCPWCGKNLPPSKRDEWLEALYGMGYEDPMSNDIPDKYKSDKRDNP